MPRDSHPSATVHRRIEFSDVDSSGRYHYGTVIRLLEAAEVELLSGLGLLDSIYTSMPRARLEVDYLSTLRFMDEVDVTVEVELHQALDALKHRKGDTGASASIHSLSVN